MTTVLVALVVVAILGALLWRATRRPTTATADDASRLNASPGDSGTPAASATRNSGQLEETKTYPPAGFLLPDGVLGAAQSAENSAGGPVEGPGATPATIWEALENASAPVAVEYYPVSQAEIAKLRIVPPVNAAAQSAMQDIVETLGPKTPTLYRVVLPKGAELVRAKGYENAFRGFSRTGGKTAQGVWKPVAAGTAVAASWPVLAVAGTVAAVDVVAQREQRAHQRRVEGLLGRQEQHRYSERIKDQRTADDQLTRVIHAMLDGRTPSLDVALKSADDEFHRAQTFLEQYHQLLEQLTDTEDGKIAYRKLEAALGDDPSAADEFFRDLHLTRAAIALQRKALVAQGAAAAVADHANPYEAMRRYLESAVTELLAAEQMIDHLSTGLAHAQLKGRWYETEKAITARQERLRRRVTPARASEGGDLAPADDANELRFLVTADGELHQVLPAEQTEQRAHADPQPGPEPSRAASPAPEL